MDNANVKQVFSGSFSSTPSIKGQVIIEFTFSMIIVLLMIFATVMIFRWAGVDLIGRRHSYDESLFQVVPGDFDVECVNSELIGSGMVDSYRCHGGFRALGGPMKQLDSYFYRPTGMNAVFRP